MPKEMALSSKQDAVFDIVNVVREGGERILR